MAYPFDLAYEGPGLTTIRIIQSGGNPYAPTLYDAPPFWLNIYTPLYHYLVAWLPFDGPHPFWNGRLVAMLAMVLAAGGLFSVGRRRTFGLSLVACAVFFAIRPVVHSTAYLKNDSLALLLSVLALLCAEKIRRSTLAVGLSALCALLAFSSKQSFLSAAFVCQLHFLMRDRRQAISFAVFLAGMAGTAGLLAQTMWGDGFWFSAFESLQRSFSREEFLEHLGVMLRQPVYLFLLAVAIGLFWIGLRRDGIRILRNIWLLYALLSGLALLSQLGGSGANTNYFIEPTLALLLWLVSVIAAKSAPWPPRIVLALSALLLACVACELAVAPARAVAITNPEQTSNDLGLRVAIAGEIRAAAGRISDLQVLNLYTAPVGSFLPGRVSLNDPFLYNVLWRRGTLSPQPLLQALSMHYFQVVVVGLNTDVNDSMDEPFIALRADYTLASSGIMQYWVPKPAPDVIPAEAR